MEKKIKMVLYGEPGVGKSTFASKSPNPLFICSDGNFAWLDLPERNGIEVASWSECKKVLADKELLNKYDTIVLDLTEDFFKWCEQEFCVKNHIDHISDLGYGKGYDTTRNEFFIEISKLIALDKHVILIMHGTTFVQKDRRGVEHTKHAPTTRIPDKVLDMIEGRVRYFLRCYTKDVEFEDGTVIKKRYLSLVPKPNEFGIIRGVDENKIPQDIELDWDEFANIIGLDTKTVKETQEVQEEQKKPRRKKEIEQKQTKEETSLDEVVLTAETQEPHQIVEEVKDEIKEEVKDEVKKEVKEEVKEELSNEDKLAAIKAKLARLNKGA